MKQAINFRLSKEAIFILAAIAEQAQLSKTEVVEKALRYYSHQKLQAKSKLLECAGTISENEADEMLKTIRSNKHNKEKETKL